MFDHSRDVEGSLDRVQFAAELEFRRYKYPGYHRNSSNVYTEWAGIYLKFIILILICL